MYIHFRLLPKEDIQQIVPFLFDLNEGRITEDLLAERASEMATQNYECIGIYEGERLAGICGLWCQTRHYAGKSMELDHIYIEPGLRDQGIGSGLLDYIYELADQRACQWIELNTYVENFPSHRFYYRHGFVGRGLHFIKALDQA